MYIFQACKPLSKNRIRLPTQIPAKIVHGTTITGIRLTPKRLDGSMWPKKNFPSWALSTNAGTHLSFISWFERIPLESSLFRKYYGLMDLMNVYLFKKSKTKQKRLVLQDDPWIQVYQGVKFGRLGLPGCIYIRIYIYISFYIYYIYIFLIYLFLYIYIYIPPQV